MRALESFRAWFRAHWLAFIVGVLTVALGATLEFCDERILAATGRLFDADQRGRPDFVTAGFWIGTLVWAVLLAQQLGHEDATQRARVRELHGAIVRAPNTKVFDAYRTRFLGTVSRALSAMQLDPDAPLDTRIGHLEVGFDLLLKAIARLGADFRGASKPDTYGANVMLLVRRIPGETPFPPALVQHLRFHDRSNLGALEGMLFLPPELMVANRDEHAERHVPLLALPVLDRSHAGHERLILPGAASAVRTGIGVVYEDTRVISDRMANFDVLVREEVVTYFSDGGDGRAIRSFASYQITDGQQPLGAINIDCCEPDLLGPAQEYYPTFDALLAPVARMLAPHVATYARLRNQRGDLFGPPPPLPPAGPGRNPKPPGGVVPDGTT